MGIRLHFSSLPPPWASRRSTKNQPSPLLGGPPTSRPDLAGDRMGQRLLAVGQARNELWQINNVVGGLRPSEGPPALPARGAPCHPRCRPQPHTAWTYIIAEPLRACKCLKKTPTGVLQWHDKQLWAWAMTSACLRPSSLASGAIVAPPGRPH
jgi:hypothetical protein